MAITDFAIGQMRSSVAFYSNSPAANDSGGHTDNWVLMVTTRGRLRNNSGSKMNEQGQVVFDDSYELICRYEADLVIDPKAKIIIDSNSYRIKYFKLIDEIKHLYQLILAKVQK